MRTPPLCVALGILGAGLVCGFLWRQSDEAAFQIQAADAGGKSARARSGLDRAL